MQSYAITKQIRQATDSAAKQALQARKLKLFTDAERKADTEKKAATQALKALYTKAYARYCTPDKIKTDAACTNPLMKKMYGGIAKDEKEQKKTAAH